MPIIVETNPYPHIVVDSYFKEFSARELNQSFPSSEAMGGSVRMDNDLFCGDDSYADTLVGNPVYSTILTHFSSSSFINEMLELFDAQIEENLRTGELLFDPRNTEIIEECIENRVGTACVRDVGRNVLFPRIDLGSAGIGYGLKNGGKGIHTDNRRRLFSALFYVNEPINMVGGEHRLYHVAKDYSCSQEKSYRAIANRLVVSLQSNKALHDVNPIVHTDELRKAIYIGVTTNVNIWAEIKDKKLSKLTQNRHVPGFFEKVRNKLLESSA